MIIQRIILTILLFIGSFSLAQNDRQQQLETKLASLNREIRQMNSLLRDAKEKKLSVITIVETLNQKIVRLEEIIKLTNRRMNLLTQEIHSNQQQISDLRNELKSLKDDYAGMIRRSYRSRGDQNRIMFLLSSESFLQAYKRMQYMAQYAKFRKEQGELIAAKTLELQDRNKLLLDQKQQKQDLLVSNKEAQEQLKKEKQEQEELLALAATQESDYASQLREKQREARKVDKEIRKIIEAAIAASNGENAGSSRTFALTPEARELARNFVSNKGALPWPVSQGAITVRYGEQPSPIAPSVPINSSGLRILTAQGENATAIFNGKVMAIQKSSTGILRVMIQHGNYISVYNNLKSVVVSEGDTVNTGDNLGEIYTSQSTGKTELKFSIWKENQHVDPTPWILSN